MALAGPPGCAITWRCRSFPEGDIVGAARHIGCVGPVLGAHRDDSAAARLPVRRRARRPHGLRRLAAHDRRYDEPAAEGLRAAGSCRFQGGLSGGGSIRRIAIADLKALVMAGRKAGVDSMSSRPTGARPGSKGRSRGWVRTSGEAEAKRFSARAGHSEHQLGTAIDFKAAGGGSPWTQAFARSRHARWLAANAWRFGWIQSYPPGAETQTCYGAEAWHYRYVGRTSPPRSSVGDDAQHGCGSMRALTEGGRRISNESEAIPVDLRAILSERGHPSRATA